MTLEQDVKELLSDPAVQNLLKNNDLDAVYDFYYEAFSEDYNFEYVTNILENILKSAGIEPLEYLTRLAWYKGIDFSEPMDFSKYKNIKIIEVDGFNSSEFYDALILPDSIQTIEECAFYYANFYDDSFLQISTKSLVRVGYDALNIESGYLIIDDRRFEVNPNMNAQIADYLKKYKNITYKYD